MSVLYQILENAGIERIVIVKKFTNNPYGLYSE